MKLGGIRKDEGDILDFAPPPKAGGETRPAYAGVPGALLPVSPTLTYWIIQQIRIGPLGEVQQQDGAACIPSIFVKNHINSV